MQKIKEEYIKFSKEAELKKKEYETQVDKEEKLIEKYQKLIEKHTKLRDKAQKKAWRSYINWVDGIVEPLAKLLAERAGKSYKIYGPFGMGCHTTIYLVDNINVCITKQDTWSITLEPHNLDEAEVYYQGEKLDLGYSPNSIGSLNGFDYKYYPLPSSIEEIESLLGYCHKDLEKV